jgi:hypothetical protein
MKLEVLKWEFNRTPEWVPQQQLTIGIHLPPASFHFNGGYLWGTPTEFFSKPDKIHFQFKRGAALVAWELHHHYSSSSGAKREFIHLKTILKNDNRNNHPGRTTAVNLH